MKRATRLAIAAIVAGLVGALALPAGASAHVTVSGDAVQGGYGRVTVRVPNESDSAGTTKVELFLPEDRPIPSVSVMPVPGWTIVAERRKLATPVKTRDGEITEAASKITWTAAAGTSIRSGEFMEFPVSLGPLPEAERLMFKAVQTYSDGTVVRWIDEAADAEHPAPVLTLAAAAPSGSPTSASGNLTARNAPDEPDGGESPAALWVALVALVAGLGGLVLGGLAFARSRR